MWILSKLSAFIRNPFFKTVNVFGRCLSQSMLPHSFHLFMSGWLNVTLWLKIVQYVGVGCWVYIWLAQPDHVSGSKSRWLSAADFLSPPAEFFSSCAVKSPEICRPRAPLTFTSCLLIFSVCDELRPGATHRNTHTQTHTTYWWLCCTYGCKRKTINMPSVQKPESKVDLVQKGNLPLIASSKTSN